MSQIFKDRVFVGLSSILLCYQFFGLINYLSNQNSDLDSFFIWTWIFYAFFATDLNSRFLGVLIQLFFMILGLLCLFLLSKAVQAIAEHFDQ